MESWSWIRRRRGGGTAEEQGGEGGEEAEDGGRRPRERRAAPAKREMRVPGRLAGSVLTLPPLVQQDLDYPLFFYPIQSNPN